MTPLFPDEYDFKRLSLDGPEFCLFSLTVTLFILIVIGHIILDD